MLLLSSLVIFIVSWNKFFSHDINILHFNNTLALFMAIISVPLIYPGYNANRGTAGCIVISFVLNCLWTNVFISSLSIAIAVFYTIWIVSIRHTARKLYKYLIPIGWGVSLLWSAASVLYNILIFKPSDYNPCFLFNRNRNFEIGWSFLGPMIVILLINTLLLILSLVKIWLVLRKQNTQEGELKRLRRVAIGGILLVPALGFPFISVIALQLYDAFNYDTATLNISSVQKNIIAFLIILIINSPIGIAHFILITCQINETILRKYCCCCCRRTTPAQIAHSLHLNIARRAPKANRDTPDDVIPDSVPATESTVHSSALQYF